MKKKSALGTPPRQTLSLRVAGVPVRVRVDGEGRPCSATSAGFWIDPDDPTHARLVELAAKDAIAAVASAAQADQRKTSSATAAAASADKRAAASVDHWANHWLALAHAEYPQYGKERLAQHARSLAFKAKIEPASKRDEISVYRARQFLDRQREPRG